ncbi:uncharacterized protein LOC143360837 [Halictus rubicundus]|uniref:uncharacterized protein LOC143360837 n=1 Tax=Halictus rubicundus TaxID=77578 RepID=UPI0040366A68
MAESSRKKYKKSSARNKTIQTNKISDKFHVNGPETSTINSSFIKNNTSASYHADVVNIDEIPRALNNGHGRINIRRSRRSSSKKLRHLEKRGLSPKNRFYRHPNLSYEDRNKLKDKLQKEAINLNLGNTLKRRVQSTLNPSGRSYKFEFSSGEPGKQGSIPNFPKANSSSISEADNHNKSAAESSTNSANLAENKSDKYTESETSKNSKNDKNHKNHKNPDGGSKEKTYISIQDHQRDIKMTTSSDIPEYDPSKIPYVDVPDYSDIREESLDAEDRRLSKNKMAEAEPEYVEGPETNSNKDGEASWMDENSDSFKRKLTISQNDGFERKLESNEDGGSTEPAENENSKSQFESAIFDINEYRKPFNLDEFLKDDPIMKKLQLLEKETPALYGGNRKRAGVFNETESDNHSTEWSRPRGAGGSR